MTVLAVSGVLAGCGDKEMGKALIAPSPSPVLSPPVQLIDRLTLEPTVQATVVPTVLQTPTAFVLGPFFDPSLDLRAGPIEVPLELQIPSIKVKAPVLGVGLTKDNVMDAPKGPVNDPVWGTAFWYRGSSIPGDVGTATIAGHLDDPFGDPQIFARLGYLKSGDLIIIHVKNTTVDLRFIVDETKVYTIKESSDPAVLKRVYGAGPVSGSGPQPSADGLAHLTLITCAGNYVHGQFDQYTVVYATRINNPS